MLAMLPVFVRSQWPPFARIRAMVDETLAPLVSQCSTGELLGVAQISVHELGVHVADIRVQGCVTRDGHLVEVGLIGVGVGLPEVEVLHPVDGHHVDVDVGHLEAGDQHAHASRRQGDLLGSAHGVGDAHEMRGGVGIEGVPFYGIELTGIEELQLRLGEMDQVLVCGDQDRLKQVMVEQAEAMANGDLLRSHP